MNLDEFVRQVKLFEIYQTLLKPNQKEVLALYLEKNFSISEIAQIKNTSRQAIFKTITNSLRNIEELESLLGFLKKQNIFFNNYKSIEQCLNELLKIIEKEDNLLLKNNLLNNISKLQKTINKMKEEV